MPHGSRRISTGCSSAAMASVVAGGAACGPALAYKTNTTEATGATRRSRILCLKPCPRRNTVPSVVCFVLLLLWRRLARRCFTDGSPEADHHLFPCLIAPADVLGRIGVVLVRGRVVVMRDDFD